MKIVMSHGVGMLIALFFSFLAAGVCMAGDLPSARELSRNTGKGDFPFDARYGPALKVCYTLPVTFTAHTTINAKW